MTEERDFIGGCLCGRIRYEASNLMDACYCHCRLCQQSGGAPVLAWAAFPTTAFSYSKGAPGTYASSSNARREFCTSCGTQLTFRDDRSPERIDVTMASLDDPTAIEPEYHIWTASRIRWLHIADELPRYTDEGPE